MHAVKGAAALRQSTPAERRDFAARCYRIAATELQLVASAEHDPGVAARAGALATVLVTVPATKAQLLELGREARTVSQLAVHTEAADGAMKHLELAWRALTSD